MAEHDLDALPRRLRPVEDIFHIDRREPPLPLRLHAAPWAGSSSPRDAPFIAVDFRYFEQAEKECAGLHAVPDDRRHRQVVRRRSSARPGSPASASASSRLTSPSQSVPGDQEGDRRRCPRPTARSSCPRRRSSPDLRAIKEPAEIETLQRAVDVGDAAFVARRRSASSPAGPRSRSPGRSRSTPARTAPRSCPSRRSSPPGRTARCRTPSRRDYAIQDGDPVVIDMGVIVDGYCSDLTRTIVCGGKPDNEVPRRSTTSSSPRSAPPKS